MLLQAIRIQHRPFSFFQRLPVLVVRASSDALFRVGFSWHPFSEAQKKRTRQRRAEMACARKLKPDRAMAIHEAGHALAHVLTADLMGIIPEEAVEAIEIRPTRVRAGEGEAYEASITIITSG